VEYALEPPRGPVGPVRRIFHVSLFKLRVVSQFICKTNSRHVALSHTSFLHTKAFWDVEGPAVAFTGPFRASHGLSGPHMAFQGLVGPKSNFDRVAKRNLSHSKSTRVINVIKRIFTEGMFELPLWRVFVYDLRIHTACCVETGLDKTDNTLTVSH